MGAHVYEKQTVCVGICGPLPPTLAALSRTVFPPSWLVFSPHRNAISHRRTMTVMRSPVQPDRAWCITSSPLNSPAVTTPILQLRKPRIWEPEKLCRNYARTPLWHGASQNTSLLAPGSIAVPLSARQVRCALYTLIHFLPPIAPP